MFRNQQIDALRAIAAMLVLIAHASEWFMPSAQAQGHSVWLYHFSFGLDFGRIGVVVFFIISGYVVANTLLKPCSSIKHFIIRRAFRLYPLYWLSIIGALIFFTEDIETRQLLANIAMTPLMMGEDPLLGLYWTLETELIFYTLAIFLFAVHLLKQPTALLVCILALITAFACFMLDFLPAPSNLSLKSLPLNLSFMLLGVLIYTTQAHRSEKATHNHQSALLFAAIALTLTPSAYSLMLYFSNSSADNLRWALSYPLAVAIFFVVMRGSTRLTKPLAKLGLISYSVYLAHPFAIALLGRWPETISHLLNASGLIGIVLSVTLLTLLISMVTYHCLERPFITLSKRLSDGR